MSSRLFPALICSVTCLTAIQAAEVAPKPPPYSLKNRSAFTPVSDETRAPFWPIGWIKRAAAAANAPVVPVPKLVFDDKSFKVTSILLGSPSLVIINGRTYSEGEFLRTPKAIPVAGAASPGALPPGVRIRVYRINDGGVVLQHQEQLITVALLRPELLQRRDDEVLLLEDRP